MFKKPLLKKILISILFVLLSFSVVLNGQKDSTLSNDTLIVEEVFSVVEDEDIFPDILPCQHLENLKSKKDCFADTLQASIYKYLEYPALALKHDIEGVIVIELVFDNKLNTYCLRIIKDIGAKTADAALRATELALGEIIPHYKGFRCRPRKPRGNPVEVTWYLPVRFKK